MRARVRMCAPMEARPRIARCNGVGRCAGTDGGSPWKSAPQRRRRGGGDADDLSNADECPDLTGLGEASGAATDAAAAFADVHVNDSYQLSAENSGVALARADEFEGVPAGTGVAAALDASAEFADAEESPARDGEASGAAASAALPSSADDAVTGALPAVPQAVNAQDTSAAAAKLGTAQAETVTAEP
jgi:hypothetical protein